MWSGNYLISVDNEPYLIDLAVSYGQREFDIAMITLFGGFSNEFYEAYNYHFPLAKRVATTAGYLEFYIRCSYI